MGDALYRQGWECPLPSSVKDGNTAYHQACECPVPIRMGMPLTAKRQGWGCHLPSRKGMPLAFKRQRWECPFPSSVNGGNDFYRQTCGCLFTIQHQRWEWPFTVIRQGWEYPLPLHKPTSTRRVGQKHIDIALYWDCYDTYIYINRQKAFCFYEIRHSFCYIFPELQWDTL